MIVWKGEGMDKDTIFEKVRTIISQGTRGRIRASDIDFNVDLVSEMGIDSIEALELTLMIEEEFSVRVEDDDLNREFFRSLKGLVDYIHERTAL